MSRSSYKSISVNSETRIELQRVSTISDLRWADGIETLSPETSYSKELRSILLILNGTVGKPCTTLLAPLTQTN
jgi:hypothetical protein